ncbi:MAG: GldG family protein, partial [Armatimonadota bacterium]
IVAVKWERERRGQAGGTLGMRAAEAEPLPPFEWNVWVIVALALATVAIGGNVYYGVSKGAWLAPTLGFLVAAALIALAYWAGRRAAGVCGTILLGAGGLCTMSAMVAWLVTGGEGVFAIVTFLAEGAALLVAGGIVLARAPGRTWTTIGKPLIGLAALILFVGILGLVNFIAVRYGGEWKWDSTENKYYSLSDMTRQIVKKLDQPVEVVGFYTAGPWSQRDEADRLYRQYNDLSPKLKTALYDTRLDLAQVKKYNPPSNNVTIVKCGDNRKEVYSVNEQDITSAILEVTERKKKKVYFLEGHGERAIEGGDENSYTHVAGKLRDLQYDVETLNLISGEEAGSSDTVVLDEATEEKAGEVPGDCSVLCIVGPKMPLRESEIEAINDYLDRGGDAFIALGGPGDPDLSEVLSRWEIKVGEGNVIDPGASWFGSPTLVTVIPQRDHPVLKDLNRVVTALPLPRPIETTEESPPPSPYAPSPPQPDSVSLFSSSSASWEETGITPETTEVSRDPDERSGPLSLAVAVDAPPKTGPDAEEEPEPPSNPWEPPKERTKGKQRTRMVVIGTTDFAEDDYARQVKGNEALFLNSINWLAERTKLISLPPKEKGEHRLNLTGNVRRFVMLLTLILAPLSVAIVGGIVWWVRR